ncbi:MAG: S-formylglutathione hydrolase [Betaproteobacteria bacterium]|nr:S-formylglutathione hydrolase [Betaproteobacteria bacterium]
MPALEIVSEQACYGGVQGFYRHDSRECASRMRFSVYRPPQAAAGPVPVLYWLAGLTCTEETFMVKAGAQRLAARLGLMLVAPDTSPREPRFPGDDESWDFGLGAGFYVDATEAPWSANYRMYSYVTAELPAVIGEHFAADTTRQGIFGHSMGGHGALVCALREPGRYRSVSAFSPVAAPSQAPWGENAFARFLGEDPAPWGAYDATELARGSSFAGRVLIDQGEADKFLATQLMPEKFVAACAGTGIVPRLRRHPGYDHSYWFVQTFIADHLRHHAGALSRPGAA